MTAVTAATWVFAVLLAVAGGAKVTSPAATSAALQGARLVANHRLVRLLGLGEVGLALAVLLIGGRIPAVLLALAYAVFAAFSYRQSRRGAGCGCFGETDAPATRLHVAIDAAGAAVALGSAVSPAPSLAASLSGDVLLAVVILGLLALCTTALRLALTALPELAAAVALASPRQDGQ